MAPKMWNMRRTAIMMLFKKIKEDIMDRQIKTADKIAFCIKNARKSSKMTQEEAAQILGYSERQYRRFETEGLYDILVIDRIAALFNVDIKNILFEQ